MRHQVMVLGKIVQVVILIGLNSQAKNHPHIAPVRTPINRIKGLTGLVKGGRCGQRTFATWGCTICHDGVHSPCHRNSDFFFARTDS